MLTMAALSVNLPSVFVLEIEAISIKSLKVGPVVDVVP